MICMLGFFDPVSANCYAENRMSFRGICLICLVRSRSNYVFVLGRVLNVADSGWVGRTALKLRMLKLPSPCIWVMAT